MSESTLIIDEDGSKRWLNKEGKYHRTDGPAVEWADGTKVWRQNGEIHRENGPAIEFYYGVKEWVQNGKRHRVDGPAIERPEGNVSWFHNRDYLGEDIEGFWNLWKLLDEEGRQNVNLHMWLARLQNV